MSIPASGYAPLEVIPENQVLDTSESFFSSTSGAKGEFLSPDAPPDQLVPPPHAVKEGDGLLSPSKSVHDIQVDRKLSDLSKDLEIKVGEWSRLCDSIAVRNLLLRQVVYI